MARRACVLELDDIVGLEEASRLISAALEGLPLDREQAHNALADITDLITLFDRSDEDDDGSDLDDTDVYDEEDDLIFEPTDGQTTASTY